jgi:hypothetical protein
MLPKTAWGSGHYSDVRCTTAFPPMNRHSPAPIERPFRDRNGREQSQQGSHYSIPSSVRARQRRHITESLLTTPQHA